MNVAPSESFEDDVERMQELLAALEGLGDPRAKETARELVQVVISLHRLGLSDLLAIVGDSADQPADALMPKFIANPRISALLVLHGLHPLPAMESEREGW